MRVVITGGHGFLGWHLACRLRALHGIDPVRLGRQDFDQADRLFEVVADAEVVVHVAGVNRGESDAIVRDANVDLAQKLAAAIIHRDSPIRVVYANSIQAEGGTPYGEGKAHAARVLATAVDAVGGSLADVVLPNLFGEHGRPHYNSFVATFSHLLAHEEQPIVVEDREVPLLHAQAAAEVLIESMGGSTSAVVRQPGEQRTVSEVLGLLRGFHDTYADGDIPDLSDPFSTDLFNTYRSYLFPQAFPIDLTLHADDRGILFETGRFHGGTGQSYFSSTRPGRTRGEHFHLRKVERFVVVQGEAEIRLRRLLHDEVVSFRLSGDRPALVDMPTLWVHNIRNVGQTDLLTLFWSDQLLDPQSPDQFPELVEATAP